MVSLIIPTLNEEQTIGRVLAQVPQGVVDEVLVIDGHSTDATREMALKMGAKVILQEGGKGYGRAAMTGIKYAAGDIIVFLTADLSQNPQDIPKLLAKLNEGYALVMASRYIKGGGSSDDTFLHYIGNKFFTFLCNFLHGSRFSDSLYFFLAAKKEVFEKANAISPGFEYCIEFPIKAHKAGFKIAQIPSFEKKRLAGEAKVRSFRHGWKILLKILKP